MATTAARAAGAAQGTTANAMRTALEAEVNLATLGGAVEGRRLRLVHNAVRRRAGRCQGKECGTRATAGRAGDTLTQDGHALLTYRPREGVAGAWPDPSAVAPTRPCDRGQVSDPPGAVRRRTSKGFLADTAGARGLDLV